MRAKRTAAEQRAQHTCMKDISSMNCRACNAGVPYPHESVKDMLKRMTPPPVLRPYDIAWQAYQAGAAVYEGYDIDHLNKQFKAWWKRHPRTLPDGELKKEP